MSTLVKLSLAFFAICMVIATHESTSKATPELRREYNNIVLSNAVAQYEETHEFRWPDNYQYEDLDDAEKWSMFRDIGACESGNKFVIQPVEGRGYDVGPLQVNTHYHVVRAAGMGLDLFNPKDNMLYAMRLFDEHYTAIRSGIGWTPWEATRECWTERRRIRHSAKGGGETTGKSGG